nr:MAG TPA: molecular chaperone protein [Inoviridae sp.]
MFLRQNKFISYFCSLIFISPLPSPTKGEGTPL